MEIFPSEDLEVISYAKVNINFFSRSLQRETKSFVCNIGGQ
jgi:hypothetical protein